MDWFKKLWKALFPTDSAPIGSASSQVDMVRPAVWADVFELTRLLEKHQAKYILVGGYALNFNGLVRQTGDVDILVKNDPENNRRWIAALCELPDGAAKELVPDSDAPFPTEVTEDGDDEPGVIRVADEFLVDVMPKTCGKTYEELLPYASRVTTENGQITVLDLQGLLITKQGVRAKDVADRKLIEAALATLRQKTSEHVATMARRSFLKDAPLPPAGEYEIREPEPTDEEDDVPKPK
jgi:hypothetical protein